MYLFSLCSPSSRKALLHGDPVIKYYAFNALLLDCVTASWFAMTVTEQIKSLNAPAMKNYKNFGYIRCLM